MPTTNPAKHAVQIGLRGRGPEIMFAAAALAGLATLATSSAALSSDLVLPATSTLFFALALLATLAALVAARRQGARAPDRITYWDVAGALTLCGICVASQIDPEQMVRLVEGEHRMR
jgi:Na+/H+ antiporter NhaA